MKKQSGKQSVTIWINILLNLGANLGGLLGWLSGVVSPQTWLVVSGICGSVAGIVTIVRHVQKGGHVSDPLLQSRRRTGPP